MRAQYADPAKGVEGFLRPRQPRPRILSWGFVIASALVAFGVVWAATYQRSLVTELTSQGEAIEEAQELVQAAERGMNQLVEQNQSLNLQLASIKQLVEQNLQLASIKQEDRASDVAPPPATPRAGPSRAKPSRASGVVCSRAENPPPQAMARESCSLGPWSPSGDASAVSGQRALHRPERGAGPRRQSPQWQPSMVQTAAPVPAAVPPQPQPKTSPRPRPGFSYPHFMEDTREHPPLAAEERPPGAFGLGGRVALARFETGQTWSNVVEFQGGYLVARGAGSRRRGPHHRVRRSGLGTSSRCCGLQSLGRIATVSVFSHAGTSFIVALEGGGLFAARKHARRGVDFCESTHAAERRSSEDCFDETGRAIGVRSYPDRWLDSTDRRCKKCTICRRPSNFYSRQ